MCQKVKSIAEVERAVNDISRPMRWDSAERIAKGFVRECLDSWVAFNKELFALLKELSDGESLTYTTLLRRERKTFHLREKKADPKPADIQALILELGQYLRPDQVQAMEGLFATYSEKFFVNDPTSRTGIWNKHLPDVWQDGYDKAYNNLERNAKIQGELSRLEGLKTYAFNPNNFLVQSYYTEAYQLVTSKISIAAKGEALVKIAEGLREGVNWEDISENIYDVVGRGYRYHWQRLVRTEMTQAYYRSFVERYQGAGAEYVKLSLSLGACPICVGIDGYYRLGFEPPLTASTHPNCRCVYLPFFRLPEGVQVRN